MRTKYIFGSVCTKQYHDLYNKVMNNNVHCYFQDEDPNKNANMLMVQNDRFAALA